MCHGAAIFKILDGGRPMRPEGALILGLSDDVWELVERCWQDDPLMRPDVSEVIKFFTKAASAPLSIPVIPPIVTIIEEQQ